ncbi:hypothetical protein RIF29_20064 [Crotalaria pallida]|uniref:RING-type domain-containing protein n=1 Tax=Crotalaria pallida TaxID=3830 RepID=A0AAN9F0G1_CROPI
MSQLLKLLNLLALVISTLPSPAKASPAPALAPETLINDGPLSPLSYSPSYEDDGFSPQYQYPPSPLAYAPSINEEYHYAENPSPSPSPDYLDVLAPEAEVVDDGDANYSPYGAPSPIEGHLYDAASDDVRAPQVGATPPVLPLNFNSEDDAGDQITAQGYSEEGYDPELKKKNDRAVVGFVIGAICLVGLGAFVYKKQKNQKHDSPIWVVVVPYSVEPLKLEIMIYPTQQDSQPRSVIDLWKSEIEEPAFDQRDPKLTISYRYKASNQLILNYLLSLNKEIFGIYVFFLIELDDVQILVDKVKPPPIISDAQTSSLDAPVQSEAINTNEKITDGWMDKPVNKDDYNGWGSPESKPVDQLTKNNLRSSGDSCSYNGLGTSLGAKHSSEVNTNGLMEKPATDDYNGWGLLDSKPLDQSTDNVQSREDNSPIVYLGSCSSAPSLSVPSAPPIPDEVLSEGPMHYPSINSSVLDMHVPSMVEVSMTSGRNNGARDSSCAICWDADIEGACIPCGHMAAGCMPCLNEIKVNKGVCPICMTKIDQVVRLYAV